jgi:hypothetical protein
VRVRLHTSTKSVAADGVAVLGREDQLASVVVSNPSQLEVMLQPIEHNLRNRNGSYLAAVLGPVKVRPPTNAASTIPATGRNPKSVSAFDAGLPFAPSVTVSTVA